MAIRLALAVLAAAPAAAAVEWHDTADIAEVAEAFLIDRIGRLSTMHGDTSVEAGMLDSRLKLTACDEPLEGFLRAGSKIGPRTVVGVRCPGARPWKIYVPVEVVTRARVWVARRPLPKGHLLAPEDLATDIRNVSRMTAGYVSGRQSLLGQRLRSSILAGRVLTPGLLEADNVIRRGQTVTLAARTAGLTIRMSGKALTDGAVEQRIRVENLSSGRVVEGVVRSPELVEVLVPRPQAHFQSPQSPQLAPKVTAPAADRGISNNDR